MPTSRTLDVTHIDAPARRRAAPAPAGLRFALAAAIAALAGLALPAPAQIQAAASIARWKDDAAAAYTMTMDDFCADHITGIQNYADSMFHNRGMGMAFGALVGDCDEADWKVAERMISHGHELMNHSWTHACGKAGLDWCQPYWGEDKHALEIDKAGRTAEERLGIKVRFYIFPYDEWEPAKISHLKAQGYLGARAGIKGALTPHDFRDGFSLNFDVNWPRNDPSRWQNQIWTLNGYIDEAIAKGGWAIRETHGVNDSSWGYLLPDELRGHLDYAKAKKDLGLLWVTGPTAILKYQKARETYRIWAVPEPERAVLHFVGTPLDTALYDAPVTVNVTLPGGLPAGMQAYQGGKPIPWVRKGDPASGGAALRLTAHPHRGPVVLTANPLLSVGIRDREPRSPALAFEARGGAVHFRLARAGAFAVELLGPDGRLRRTVARGTRPPGTYRESLDRAGLPAGLYVLRVTQAGASVGHRILLP